MPAKKLQHDPLANPARVGSVTVSDIPADDQPKAKIPQPQYAVVGGRIIVEIVKFGQLILARCEDDTMWLMQSNNTWVEFMFEIVTKEV